MKKRQSHCDQQSYCHPVMRGIASKDPHAIHIVRSSGVRVCVCVFVCVFVCVHVFEYV
jgi:hypothetical protein